jgi:leucine dehydrogenase
MTTVFDHPEFDGHEDIHFLDDGPSGFRGIIAIHSTRLGPALGGTRCLAYASDADALTDALRLSRAMTAKAAMAELPLGGGKAVILAQPGTDRGRVLDAYATRVARLGGRFITGEDVGIDEADADRIHQTTRFIAGISGREGGLGDPSPRTAEGVVGAMRAALGHIDGDRSLHGRRVVVSGLGKVGTALCELLAKDGARLTIADIAPAAVERARAQLPTPVEVVDPAVAHTIDCDVFAPCALGGVLNPATIGQLRCAAVVGSANNQPADDASVELLADRGVLYVPDYVVNAGGLIQVAGEWLGFPLDEIERRVERIEGTVDTLLDTATHAGITPAAAAAQIVARRLARAA